MKEVDVQRPGFLPMCLGLALLLLSAGPAGASGPLPIRTAPGYRTESIPVYGGAELVTLFTRNSGAGESVDSMGEIPVLSLLRDTLGDSDPGNDRLRQVWIFTYARPSVWQKFAASVPFLYRQVASSRKPGGGVPQPVLDLSQPARGSWGNLVKALLQSEILDDYQFPIRMASRSYLGNTKDYRNLHIWQAVSALAEAEQTDGQSVILPRDEYEQLGARLLLSTRILGGFVSQEFLATAWEKQVSQSNQDRGRNWELLRQKAEENGLYFQPLSLGGREVNFVLLWVERMPPQDHSQHKFNGQLLGIGSPYTDARIRNWQGYTETWWLDADGLRLAEGDSGARAARMVPLALYALDHPRVPLLLVDFRSPRRTGATEIFRRAAHDITTGALGLARLGNWQYLAAKSTWMFVRGRRGAALDRSARLRAYADLRYALKFGGGIDSALGDEIRKSLRHLGLNPLDHGAGAEAFLARKQYASLLDWAHSPDGLRRRLERDRQRELASEYHSPGTRALFTLATVGSLGLYRHRQTLTRDGFDDLDQCRRLAYNRRFLERASASEPRPEVAWNAEDVGRSLNAVAEIGKQSPRLRREAEQTVLTLVHRAGEDWTSRQCASCLQLFGDAAAPGSAARTARTPSASPPPSFPAVDEKAASHR